MSKQYTVGDVLDVKIQKIVPRGLGLAFAEKLTVLVPLAVAGDVLRVKITEIKKRMAFAEIVEVRQGGPRRIVAPCPYFGTCGGCDFQQMDYNAQLQAKIGIVRDCLERIGKIAYDDEITIIAGSNEFGYRSRARWHLDREKPTFGYYARDSHDVIDIHACPILTPGLQATLEHLRRTVQWENVWDSQAQIEAAIGHEERVSIFSADMPEPTSEITFESGGFTYTYSAETFFQANKLLIPELIDAALGNVRGGTAFDLYCGVGLFTLPLAVRFDGVVAVEGNPKSIKFARQNAGAARLTNIAFVDDGVGRFLRDTRDRKPEFVLIDPPRSGTEKQTIPALARLKPAHISYVSCEPSILARDLGILVDAGYRIDTITAIDLFPQTHHVETVVHLSVK